MYPFLSIGIVDRQTRQRWRADGLTVVDGFARDVPGWSLARHVCVGHVNDSPSLADSIEAASRGASLAVTVTDAFADELFDDALRAGLRAADDVLPGKPRGAEPGSEHSRPVAGADPPPTTITPEWAPLLELLADGMSVAQAARSCHLSLRSAYRRLDTARTSLGVTSTTAAVVAWRSRTG